MISEFINSVDEIYVIEENDTFLEEQIKALGYKVSGKCAYEKEITGKAKIPIVGELDPTVLARAFGLQKESPYKPLELPARPPVLCPGCPHRGVFLCPQQAQADGHRRYRLLYLGYDGTA